VVGESYHSHFAFRHHKLNRDSDSKNSKTTEYLSSTRLVSGGYMHTTPSVHVCVVESVRTSRCELRSRATSHAIPMGLSSTRQSIRRLWYSYIIDQIKNWDRSWLSKSTICDIVLSISLLSMKHWLIFFARKGFTRYASSTAVLVISVAYSLD
jgi:hypothetical protein